MNRTWLTTLIPGAIGLSLAALWQASELANPILYLRADAGTLIGGAGLGLTLLALLGQGIRSFQEGRCRAALAQLEAEWNDQRRRFLRRLDHELKNPLTAVRAGLANLSGAPEGQARQNALASVESQVVRLSRLTGDLRKLAEIETLEFDRTLVQVEDLLRLALSQAEDNPAAQNRHLNLTLPRAPWPLPEILGDRDLLLLALHNLVDNALKFTRTGDTVEVRAFEDGQNVVVEVADTGPGVSPEEQPHLWEELYRGQSARGVPGSGLGLPLVRAIVERHGGEAVLRSRVGAGTVVTIRLPTA